MRLRETIPFLKNILEDKSKSLSIRSQAAWAFHKVTKNNADLIVPIMADRFFDREEDHEIRIASYGALAKSKSPAELTAIIRYIVDNAQNEDRQVVSYVISSIKAAKNLKYPEGTACKGNMAERSHELWDMIRPVASEFGPQDILDSGVFYMKSFESMDDVLVSIIASKDDVMPRAIFAMARDGIVSGSFSVNTVSDGLVYKNAAQLKLMLDQMRNKIRTEKADVKQQLSAVLNAAKSRPVSEDFSLIFSARIDSHERLYERFTKPEQLIQRVMAKSLVAEKYLRTFKSLGHLYVKSHTESGLRVAFVTLQTGISSAAKPQFAVGQLGKHGLPLSLKYNYKFVSRIIFSSVVGLPSSNYRFITGRISDKATAVHRNVSMSVSRGQSGDLSLATIKIRSDPLEGTANKDIFYRSIAPFHGNVESMKDYTKLLISEKKPPTVYSKGHEYLGFGATVTKSPEHTRPSIFKSPITRFCTGYQEIPTCKKPYTLKVSLSAPAADSSAIASFQVNLVSGRKGDKYIKLGALTVDDPKDNSKKVLRVVLGKAINVDDPNKRFVNFAYENRASNLFVRAFYDVQMPDTKLAIPKIVRHSSEWKTAYAGEKILINAKLQYSSSGRDDFDMEAEVNDLANGQTGDADAVLEEEFYRTAEQADAFEIGTNTVGFSENGAYMKQFNNMKTKDNFLTWKTVLAFHGFKGKLTLKKQIPDEVKLVWKKIRFVTSAMYYRHLSYDVNTKADPSTIHVSMNSTIDNSLSDLVITDKEGRQSITNYKSKVAKYMRPSSSPVPVAGKKMLNLPLCTYLGSRDDFGVDTFDGKSVFFDALNSKKCSYLLAGNCRGKKTFAITYAIDSDTFTILYDDQQRIDVTASGFVVNGQAQPDKEGLVGKHGDTVLLAYKGLMKVMLPNKVVFIRETNSMTAYVQMSRINRGRLCGLCGDYNGDGSNDELDKLDGLETFSLDMAQNLETTWVDGSPAKIKWTVRKFKEYKRETLVVKEWPYYSSDISLPQSSHAWYLKVTDNVNYFKDIEESQNIRSAMRTERRRTRSDDFNSSDEDIRDLATRVGWTLGGQKAQVLTTLCRRTVGQSDLPDKTKLKVNVLMYLENHKADSVEKFVELNSVGDTLLASLTLPYTQFENADLFIECSLECEPVPKVVITEECPSLQKDLMTYMNKLIAEPTDVTLVASDGNVATHKTLLSVRSDVLRAMLVSELKEDSKNVIEMKETTKEVLVEFVKFLRTDTVDQLDTVASELYILADKYRVLRLKQICERYLAENVTRANSARLLTLTQQIPSNLIESRLFNLYRINSQTQ
ncbi:Speckle-type POZ protein [Halotydeus destructor]|nr:Speckle-type POZ protein [Halotydeus destructor]